MLGVLEELLENAQKHFWAAGDRLRMIRLLGRHPVDGIIADAAASAEVFAASPRDPADWANRLMIYKAI